MSRFRKAKEGLGKRHLHKHLVSVFYFSVWCGSMDVHFIVKNKFLKRAMHGRIMTVFHDLRIRIDLIQCT